MAHNYEDARIFAQNVIEWVKIEDFFMNCQLFPLCFHCFNNTIKHNIGLYNLPLRHWNELIFRIFVSKSVCISKHDIRSVNYGLDCWKRCTSLRRRHSIITSTIAFGIVYTRMGIYCNSRLRTRLRGGGSIHLTYWNCSTSAASFLRWKGSSLDRVSLTLDFLKYLFFLSTFGQ